LLYFIFVLHEELGYTRRRAENVWRFDIVAGHCMHRIPTNKATAAATATPTATVTTGSDN
jgi:hypothetical protein